MRRPVLTSVVRSVSWGTAGAVIAAVMFCSIRNDFTLGSFVTAFLIGMAFSTSIGLPAGVSFTLLWPRVFARRPPLVQALGAALLLLFIFTTSGLGVSLVLMRIGVFEANSFWNAFRTSMAIALAFTATWTAGAFVYERLRHRHDTTQAALERTEIERGRAEALAAMAQLSSLQSRVRPHFLFNALNAVLALIPENPKRAEQVLERLAALLRSSLDADAGGQHALGKEMAVVADYLEIEKARFCDRLRFRLEVPAELDAVDVPSFAVQTLVENAVKHVVALRREGGEVGVAARREEAGVVIDVTDDGPGFGEDAVRTGHGLHSLRGRLASLHGDAGRLAILRGPNGARVRLTIPLRAKEPP